jgi:outer membrane protein assembly factor BamA
LAKGYILLFFLFLKTICFSQEELIEIKEIKIKGNTYTKAKIILAECHLKIGKRVSLHQLREDLETIKQRLKALGYFYNVKVYWKPIEEKTSARILIEIEEGFLWRFDAGPIYLAIGRENLFGEGKRFLTKLGVNTQTFEYSTREYPFIIGGGVYHFAADMFNEYIVEETPNFGEGKFRVDKLAGELFLTYRGVPCLRIKNTFLGERLFFTSLSPTLKPEALGIEGPKIILKLQPQINWDKRNREWSPTKGFYLKISGEISKQFWGSTLDFEKYLLEFRSYLPLFRKGILASRLQLGKASFSTPYYYLFNIGKFNLRNEMRKIDGLRAPGYKNYVGHTMFLTNFEYRLLGKEILLAPIFKILPGVVFFFDLGKTWDENERANLTNLDFAYGFGLRFYILNPVWVNIRLEYGFGRQGNAFYWKIGSAF